MSALSHMAMLQDRVRCVAYRRAITTSVRPGDTVLDLGTGTGLLAYFALQAGAAHVYAIEQSAATLEGARALAAANGFADRITWLEGRSTDLELPVKVDGIIAEIFGNMGIEEDALRYVTDARDRWLQPGGWLVSQRLMVMLAPVAARRAYAERVEAWSRPRYGLSWNPLRALAVQERYMTRLSPQALLAPAHVVQTVDFTTLQLPAEGYAFEHTCRFTCQRAGVCHGLGGWFIVQLSPTVTLSNAPRRLRAPTHWGHNFFPLNAPRRLRRGDHLAVRFGARPLLKQLLWHWEVTWERHGRSLAHELHTTAHTMALPSSTARLAAQTP